MNGTDKKTDPATQLNADAMFNYETQRLGKTPEQAAAQVKGIYGVMPTHYKPADATPNFGEFKILKNEEDWAAFDEYNHLRHDKPKSYPCFVTETTTATYGDPDFILLTHQQAVAMYAACLKLTTDATETTE